MHIDDDCLSMTPAAAPGKPRCMVFEGVWCLKVYDIISGPDRWHGSGVSPAAGGENFWAFFSPSKHTICVCIYRYTESRAHAHIHTPSHALSLFSLSLSLSLSRSERRWEMGREEMGDGTDGSGDGTDRMRVMLTFIRRPCLAMDGARPKVALGNNWLGIIFPKPPPLGSSVWEKNFHCDDLSVYHFRCPHSLHKTEILYKDLAKSRKLETP